MPDKTNPIYKADVEVGEELAAQKKKASETAAIPYGMEKATPAMWRRMVSHDAEFRKAEHKRLGRKQYLSKWRGKG